MEKGYKQMLADKINNLTIKLKSYAFMKIFMVETQTQKKIHKIRHYDLQLEGAAHISSWMKKKLQQVYLRGFLEIKDFVPQLVSLRFIKETPPIVIERLNLKGNSLKSTGKLNSQTYREQHSKLHLPSYLTEHMIEKTVQPKEVICRSEHGFQNFKVTPTPQDSKRSNLESLLDRVRKVNSQSKVAKENFQINEKPYERSQKNSHVMSSNSARYLHKIDGARSRKRIPLDSQTMRINTANHNICIHNNDMSFCRHGKTQRVNSISNLKQIRNSNNFRVSQNYTPVTYDANFDHQASLAMSNMKKWQRNQKRSIIIAKINELQKSLMSADCPQQQEYLYGNNESSDNIYTSRDYYRIPANYSQGYLNMRATERPPIRSVVDVRVRK